jgi:AraC-like DNA-binding protein
MSEVYFRRLFKEEYGVSPQKFIIDLRIQNAVALISTGYYSLKEVALMSGYSDYKYFSIEFKKAMGVSPSQYISGYGEKRDAASR